MKGVRPAETVVRIRLPHHRPVNVLNALLIMLSIVVIAWEGYPLGQWLAG